MDLLSQLTANIDVVNIAPAVFDADELMRERVYDDFYLVVNDIRELIEHETAPIVRTTLSGKDSSLCLLATFEAYRQSIEAGLVESDRELLISTVDTLIEALPMQFFISYGKKFIERYAKDNGINVTYDIINPPLSSEFFVKWAGADKLINNPTRTGDCTPILKVDPALKHLANQRKQFDGKKVVTLTGQRIEESARRANNMRKQGVKSKDVENVINELNDTTTQENINFSPIRDWDTESVFTLLRIAGTNPMNKVSKGVIPAYFSNFALLLELYGKAANESCQITIGANNKVESSGCGGDSNRYGCNFCTRIVEDKSAISVNQKPYWSILGTSDALRVRDWLSRLSFDANARTMHPKSVDVVYNRIMFQPNVLKSRYLEKMVRYASQLTVNAQNTADRFAEEIARGTPENFEGYQAIVDDRDMHPKAKAQFLDMYKSEASKSYMPYFSVKHAVLLSFKWNMLGVASAPYRPLKIWNDIENGRGVIPFPKLNSELPASQTALTSTPAEEPIVLRFHTKAFEKEFLTKGEPFLSYWEKPIEIMDMFENSNCWSSEKAVHEYPFDVNFNVELRREPAAEYGYQYAITINKVSDNKTGKNLHYTSNWSIKSELLEFIENKCVERLYLSDPSLLDDLKGTNAFGVKKAMEQANQVLESFNKTRYNAPYFSPVVMNNGFRDTAVSVKKGIAATHRVITSSKKGAPVVKSTTRCKFYMPSTTPIYADKYVTTTQIAALNFDTLLEEEVVMHDFLDDIDGAIEPIMFNDEIFDFWYRDGGIERAIKEHDYSINLAIKHRTKRRKEGSINSVRQYSNTAPLTYLMQSAGLMINPRYTSQYKASLRRTHLFNEIGAFKLQSLSKEDLVAYQGTMTMAEHRQDKANYLLQVRAIRNQTRKTLKAAHENSKLNASSIFTTASKLMDELFDMASGHLTMAVPSNKKRAINTWFDYYGHALSSLDGLKSLILPQSDNNLLSANVSLNMQLNTLFAKRNDLLLKTMSREAFTSQSVTQWQAGAASRRMVSNMPTSQKNNALLALLSA